MDSFVKEELVDLLTEYKEIYKKELLTLVKKLNIKDPIDAWVLTDELLDMAAIVHTSMHVKINRNRKQIEETHSILTKCFEEHLNDCLKWDKIKDD